MTIKYIKENTTYTLNSEQIHQYNTLAKRGKAQQIRLLFYIFICSFIFLLLLVVLAIFGNHLIKNYLIASLIIFLFVYIYEKMTANKLKQDRAEWEKQLI